MIGLADGDQISFDSLPSFFNIEAATRETYASVAVLIDGEAYFVDRTEESPIWTMNPDTEGFKAPAGTYILQAIGYSGDGESGTASAPASITVTFTSGVVQEPVVPAEFSFRVVDSSNATLLNLQDGDTVNLNNLPSFFHVEAVPNGLAFKSVDMVISGSGYQYAHLEEEPIWTLNDGNKGFVAGAGTFTLSATGYSGDAKSGTAGQTVSINVTFAHVVEPVVNTAPVAVDDSAQTTVGTALVSIDVLANDRDAENQALSIVEATSSYGSVAIVAGKLNFTPASGFTGTATVRYTISDGEYTAGATLTVTVVQALESVSLAWDMPTQRESGAVLGDWEIQGYEILYRKVGDANFAKLSVSGSTTETATITGLVAAAYEFKIATIDATGVYSAYTSTVTIDLSN